LTVEDGVVQETEVVVMVALAKGKGMVAALAEKAEELKEEELTVEDGVEVVVMVALAKGKGMVAAL
jgi:hypothetical protein